MIKKSFNLEQEWLARYYPKMHEQIRKWFAKQLNPFNLCPNSLVFWFLIRPYSAIGVSILGLRGIAIYGRQQIEPNETIYLMFKVLEIRAPFPLVLLVLFSALGLTVADATNTLLQATHMKHAKRLKKMDEAIGGLSNSVTNLEKTVTEDFLREKQQDLQQRLDPFKLTPRMSVFFPIINNHTSVGFLTIDFKHIMFSAKQSIDPNENVQAIFRFLDLYAPFPLQIGTMILSLGLFITGAIYEYGEKIRENILDEVKRHLS